MLYTPNAFLFTVSLSVRPSVCLSVCLPSVCRCVSNSVFVRFSVLMSLPVSVFPPLPLVPTGSPSRGERLVVYVET